MRGGSDKQTETEKLVDASLLFISTGVTHCRLMNRLRGHSATPPAQRLILRLVCPLKDCVGTTASRVKDLLLDATCFLHTARLFLSKAATFPAFTALYIPSH